MNNECIPQFSKIVQNDYEWILNYKLPKMKNKNIKNSG